MGWAFWRTWWSSSPEPSRPLPDEVGLPTPPRPPAAPRDRDPGDVGPRARQAPARTSGATPGDGPDPGYESPLTAPGAADLDRAALAAAGEDVVAAVRAADGRQGPGASRVLAVAATGALAARLPALSGVDGAAAFDELEDELLHAYADLLAGRAEARTANDVDREDLLAVAHVAAAAAAVDAAGEPALLLLAGVPADVQLRAAALLLAQTADDGGGAPDRLAAEVREVFAAQG